MHNSNQMEDDDDDGEPGFAAIRSTMGFAQEVTPGSALSQARYTCTAETTKLLLHG